MLLASMIIRNASQTTARYLIVLSLVSMATIQEKKSVGEDAEKLEPLCTIGGNVKWSSHYEKQYGSFFKNFRLELPCNPAIPLLG